MKFSVLLALLLLSCSTTPSPNWERGPASGQDVSIQVLTITDFHGAMEPETVKSKSGQIVEVGGAPQLTTVIRRIQNETRSRGPLIILDGGDEFQGSYLSNSSEGLAVVKYFNFLGLTASALGNHDFDFGPEGVKFPVATQPGQDPRGALKKIIQEAKYPILAANVLENQKTPPWLKGTMIQTWGSIRVGIIGLATESTPESTQSAHTVHLTFSDSVKNLTESARSIHDQVDMIFVISHMGEAELRSVVEHLPVDPRELKIQLVLSGHLHKNILTQVRGIPLVQSGSYGKYVGWFEFPLHGTPIVHDLIPVCSHYVTGPTKKPTCEPLILESSSEQPQRATLLGQTIVPDPEVLKLFKNEYRASDQKESELLGPEVTGELKKGFDVESSLGNFLADLYVASASDFMNESFRIDSSKIVGVANGGTLRKPIREGKLTYGSMYDLIPFDNYVAMMLMSGKDLARMVALGHSQIAEVLDWSGITLKAKGCAIQEILVHGSPLVLNEKYLVMTSDFIATGGSGTSKLKFNSNQVKVLTQFPFVREKFVELLRTRSEFQRLDPEHFFDPKNPRQQIEGKCKRAQE